MPTSASPDEGGGGGRGLCRVSEPDLSFWPNSGSLSHAGLDPGKGVTSRRFSPQPWPGKTDCAECAGEGGGGGGGGGAGWACQALFAPRRGGPRPGRLALGQAYGDCCAGEGSGAKVSHGRRRFDERHQGSQVSGADPQHCSRRPAGRRQDHPVRAAHRGVDGRPTTARRTATVADARSRIGGEPGSGDQPARHPG